MPAAPSAAPVVCSKTCCLKSSKAPALNLLPNFVPRGTKFGRPLGRGLCGWEGAQIQRLDCCCPSAGRHLGRNNSVGEWVERQLLPTHNGAIRHVTHQAGNAHRKSDQNSHPVEFELNRPHFGVASNRTQNGKPMLKCRVPSGSGSRGFRL